MYHEYILVDLTKEKENIRYLEADGGCADRKYKQLKILFREGVPDGEGGLYIAQTSEWWPISIQNRVANVDIPKKLTTSWKISFRVCYPKDEYGHSELSPIITVFFSGFSSRGRQREDYIIVVLPSGLTSAEEIKEASILLNPSNKRYPLTSFRSYYFEGSNTPEFFGACLSPMNKIVIEDRPTSFEVSVTKKDGKVIKSGITQFRLWNIENPTLTMSIPSTFPRNCTIRMNILRYLRATKKGEVPSYEVISSAGKVSLRLEDIFLNDHIKVQLSATDGNGKVYYGPIEEWLFYEYIFPIEPLSAHDPLNRLNLLGTDKIIF